MASALARKCRSAAVNFQSAQSTIENLTVPYIDRPTGTWSELNRLLE
jgi:hypothetical protein